MFKINRSELRPQMSRWPGALLLLSAAVISQTVAAQPEGITPQATKLLQASTSYLAGQARFSVDTRSSIEVVLETGQKIQFDHAVSLTVQRPDKLRAERIGDLVDQVFYYDGRSLTLHNPDDNYYATLSAPKTLEEMLDFARETLDIVAPAGDLVYTNAFEILMQDVTSGFVVDKSVVNGVPCEHLAFRSEYTDWQIWIQQGSSPLPRKFVVTSRDVLNAPQFSVEMSNWDLAPALNDRMFEFQPRDDARKIDFLPLRTNGAQSQ